MQSRPIALTALRCNGESVDFDDTGALNDGRFFLPFGKVLCALAIDINSRELFTVVIVDGDLPMAMLSPAVLVETG